MSSITAASNILCLSLSLAPVPLAVLLSVNIKPLEVGTVAKHLLPKKMYDAWQAEVSHFLGVLLLPLGDVF
jgi:hypothetical protein